MSEIAPLFATRGNASRIAGHLGVPIQTVASWKDKAAIPGWRRAAVLAAVQQLKIEVPVETLTYLARAE